MYKKPVIVFEGIEGSGKSHHISNVSKYLRMKNIDTLKKYHKKKIILIDRFVDSTIAYQHYGFGIDLNFINITNKYLLKNFCIDFTFLNIVNKNNMIKRLKIRKSLNRYDKFNKKFYEKVQKGFIKLAQKNIKKYQIINSNKDIKDNEFQIIKTIDKLL